MATAGWIAEQLRDAGERLASMKHAKPASAAAMPPPAPGSHSRVARRAAERRAARRADRSNASDREDWAWAEGARGTAAAPAARKPKAAKYRLRALEARHLFPKAKPAKGTGPLPGLQMYVVTRRFVDSMRGKSACCAGAGCGRTFIPEQVVGVSGAHPERAVCRRCLRRAAVKKCFECGGDAYLSAEARLHRACKHTGRDECDCSVGVVPIGSRRGEHIADEIRPGEFRCARCIMNETRALMNFRVSLATVGGYADKVPPATAWAALRRAVAEKEHELGAPARWRAAARQTK